MKSLLFTLLISTSIFALGHTAVITLEFPYGSETNAHGETGVAFSNDLSTTFYNPANASFYGSRNEVNLTISGGWENLLPSLNLSDMWKSNGAIGVFLPELFGNFGMSFSQNFHMLYFGTITEYDSLGVLSNSSEAYEYVATSTFSFNWKEYISVGFSIKPFYSKLVDTSTTQEIVFDIGIRGQYDFPLANDCFLAPGIGYSITNFGQDRVTYDNDTANMPPDSINYDPLSKTMRIGFSIEGGKKDFISGALLYDFSKLQIPEGNWKSDAPIHSIGIQIRTTPVVDINQGFMFDSGGERYEYHLGFTAGLRRNAMRRFLLNTKPSTYF